MHESIFEIFCAKPDTIPERVAGESSFGRAFDRMQEIALRKPGRYFLFCRSNQKVLVELNMPVSEGSRLAQPNLTWLI